MIYYDKEIPVPGWYGIISRTILSEWVYLHDFPAIYVNDNFNGLTCFLRKNNSPSEIVCLFLIQQILDLISIEGRNKNGSVCSPECANSSKLFTWCKIKSLIPPFPVAQAITTQATAAPQMFLKVALYNDEISLLNCGVKLSGSQSP